MNAPELLRQHLIDPEICIRCNTCEETCPVDAITHDARNYVVRADKCKACLACIAPCPTGAIDNWRTVLRAQAYSIEDQFGWDALPAEQSLGESVAAPASELAAEDAPPVPAAAVPGSTVPPWSAAHPYVNLYTHRQPAIATVMGNYRVTDAAAESDTRHIVLDFGATPFPVLEGQSIGILPPGVDANGRPHHARQYSIASPRDGERPGYNNVDAQRKAYDDGFMFGRRDARLGRQANYLVYNNQYNAATKKEFSRGYLNGYRSYRGR